MANLCGISLEAEALNAQIDSAKGAIDGLIADADKGIAASIATLKADLNSITAEIEGKLDGMIPEIPAPLAKLQDKVTSLANSIQSPGGFLEELRDIKSKFPTLSLDDVISKIGIDPKKAQDADNELKALQEKGNALIATIPNLQSSINNPFLYKLLPVEVRAALGDKAAIDSVLGKGLSLTVPGFNLSDQLDKICVLVPNVELTSDGKQVEKGIPTKAPTVDATPVADPPAQKGDEIKPEVLKTNVMVKDSTTVDVQEMSSQRAVILQKYRDRISEIRDRWRPKIDELNSTLTKDNLRTVSRQKRAVYNIINDANQDAGTIRERELKAAGLVFDVNQIRDNIIDQATFALRYGEGEAEIKNYFATLETWKVIGS